MRYLYTATLRNFFIAILLMAFLPAVANAQKAKKMTIKVPQMAFMENNWNEALKQARLQNKYIFVDAYATWCGPCKMLKETTFKDAGAISYYNQNFINISIDMEKGDGPVLAQQWGINAYPTLIIFDPKGKPVLGTVGYIKAGDLIRFGKQALGK